ncbi:hypothetical protein ACHAXS_011964 [Conticribra weissflogii]
MTPFRDDGDDGHCREERSSPAHHDAPNSAHHDENDDHDDDPYQFPVIEPTRRFPRPPPPTYDPHLLREAEDLVTWAIASKHAHSPAALNHAHAHAHDGRDHPPASASPASADAADRVRHAARQSARLLSLLSAKHPPPLLHGVLLALPSAHHGRELDLLASHGRLHARLIHALFRFDPFVCGADAARGLRDLERARVRRANEAQMQMQMQMQMPSHSQSKSSCSQSHSPSRSPPRVQIDESSIRRKERTTFVTPVLPFVRYSIADAHLHLVLQMVSSNAVLAKSAVRSVWGWLTDFGGRWMAWERERRERKRRERQRQRRRRRMRMTMMMVPKERREGECGPPPQKRRKRSELGEPNGNEDEKREREGETTTMTTTIAEREGEKEREKDENGQHEREEDAEEEDPEDMRPVPGMNGLSVRFVRENFFGPSCDDDDDGEGDVERSCGGGNGDSGGRKIDDIASDVDAEERKELEGSSLEGLGYDGRKRNVEEDIAWDRLPSGRVHRLLVTLINIFRLCPRSKTDLLDEISNHFPHYKTCPAALYVWYIHLCQHLVALVPTMEAPIMTLFMDKALDMDVEIKINHQGGVCLDIDDQNEVDHEDEVGAWNAVVADSGAIGRSTNDAGGDDAHFQMVKKELFDRDDHDNDNDNDRTPTPNTHSPHPNHATKKRSFRQMSRTQTDVATPAAAQRTPTTDGTAVDAVESEEEEADQIAEIAERLDSVMTLLCKRIVRLTSFDPTSLKEAMVAVLNARRLYRQLDGVFDKKVRTTDRSKFVQFVFFVLFGRENDALETVGKLIARREEEQQRQWQQQQQQQQQQQKEPLESGESDDNRIGNHHGGRNGDLVTLTDIKLDSDLVPSATTPLNFTDPMYRGFSAKLIDLFYNPTFAGDAPRQTVVCYLASFVSRATYVCPETVCECLAALLRWAESYLEAQKTLRTTNAAAVVAATSRRSSSSAGATSPHSCDIHALFYTACQAAFYIMCFRGVEAVKHFHLALRHKDDPDSPYADIESIDIGPKRWRFLCGHAFQPVKHCLESVRIEFLHLAEDLELFRDDGLQGEEAKIDEEKFIENLWNASTKQSRNTPHGPKNRGSTSTPARKRVTIIATSALQEKKRLDGGVGGLGRGSNPLDSFFPFDPYLLEKSYRFVHPYYRNWEDCILSMQEGGDDTPCKNNNMIVIDAIEEIDEQMVEESKVIENEEEDDGDEDGRDDFSDNEFEDFEVGNDDFDDEEDADVDADADDDEDGDENEYHGGEVKHDAPKFLIPTHEDIETEIRRSRAMSTGSQCSW